MYEGGITSSRSKGISRVRLNKILEESSQAEIKFMRGQLQSNGIVRGRERSKQDAVVSLPGSLMRDSWRIRGPEQPFTFPAISRNVQPVNMESAGAGDGKQLK